MFWLERFGSVAKEGFIDKGAMAGPVVKAGPVNCIIEEVATGHGQNLYTKN